MSTAFVTSGFLTNRTRRRFRFRTALSARCPYKTCSQYDSHNNETKEQPHKQYNHPRRQCRLVDGCWCFHTPLDSSSRIRGSILERYFERSLFRCHGIYVVVSFILYVHHNHDYFSLQVLCLSSSVYVLVVYGQMFANSCADIVGSLSVHPPEKTHTLLVHVPSALAAYFSVVQSLFVRHSEHQLSWHVNAEPCLVQSLSVLH